MEQEPLVIIRCITYNHEPYIRQCLDGFVMQKTTFPFYAIVHDDASTDKTPLIIEEYSKRYPNIIHPILENENQFSKGNGMLQKIMTIASKEAKYIAFCEGDDYWTDPYKLQKEFDILEKNKAIVAVATNSMVVDRNANIISDKRLVVPDNKTGVYTLDDFLRDNHQYPTLTVMYRNTNWKDLLEKAIFLTNKFLGDWILWILLYQYGDFYFLNESTAAYRVNPTSVTHTVNEIKRWEYDFIIRKQLISVLPSRYKKYLSNNWNAYWQLGNAYKKQNQYGKMLSSLIKSFFCNPIRFIVRLYGTI